MDPHVQGILPTMLRPFANVSCIQIDSSLVDITDQ